MSSPEDVSVHGDGTLGVVSGSHTTRVAAGFLGAEFGEFGLDARDAASALLGALLRAFLRHFGCQRGLGLPAPVRSIAGFGEQPVELRSRLGADRRIAAAAGTVLRPVAEAVAAGMALAVKRVPQGIFFGICVACRGR